MRKHLHIALACIRIGSLDTAERRLRLALREANRCGCNVSKSRIMTALNCIRSAQVQA